MKKWQQEFWPNPLNCGGENRASQLNLSDVQGVFLVLFGLLVVGLLVFVAELYVYRYLLQKENLPYFIQRLIHVEEDHHDDTINIQH